MVLIGIHVQRLPVGLRRSLIGGDVLVLTHNGTHQLGVVDARVVGMLGCVRRLARQRISIASRGDVSAANALSVRVMSLLRLILSLVVLLNLLLLIQVAKHLVLADS